MWSSSSDKSSASSSISSSSSPSPFSPRLKTMEEVWKDINLSSLQTCPRNDLHQYQDFFPPPPAAPSPRVPTMLNLNSVPELNSFGNMDPLRQNTIWHHVPGISQVAFGALAVNSNGRKRVQGETENDCGDRRNKRMIKNRESAARSRARKQAYMNELEREVAHLLEENARLKKQQQQLQMAAAAQVPKKKSLSRTSTAPF